MHDKQSILMFCGYLQITYKSIYTLRCLSLIHNDNCNSQKQPRPEFRAIKQRFHEKHKVAQHSVAIVLFKGRKVGVGLARDGDV